MTAMKSKKLFVAVAFVALVLLLPAARAQVLVPPTPANQLSVTVNTAVEAYKLPAEPARSRGVWATAWRRLKNDRVGVASLAVVAVFVLMIMASSVGLVARDWQKEVAVPDAPPT
ncbi:MAG: hypothetical protein ACM3SW_04650, partial [Actinomycetota bacterium]